MANLPLLRRKKKKRVRKRRRQFRLWKRTGKKGHLKAFRRHLKATRKLTGLIRKAREPQYISPAGVKFIADFEGFSPVPTDKLDGFSTVGIGHLIAHRPITAADRQATWVKGQKTPGRLTEAEARELLRLDLHRTYEPAVMRLFERGGPLAGRWSQPLYDALVSVAYNLGVGAITPGSVANFETLHAAIRAGSPRRIANALPIYNKGPFGVLPGLVRRRNAERRLIQTGSYNTN